MKNIAWILLGLFLFQCINTVNHNNPFDPSHANPIIPIIMFQTPYSVGSSNSTSYANCGVKSPTGASYTCSSTSEMFTTSQACTTSCSTCSSGAFSSSITYFFCSTTQSYYTTYATCYSRCK